MRWVKKSSPPRLLYKKCSGYWFAAVVSSFSQSDSYPDSVGIIEILDIASSANFSPSAIEDLYIEKFELALLNKRQQKCSKHVFMIQIYEPLSPFSCNFAALPALISAQSKFPSFACKVFSGVLNVFFSYTSDSQLYRLGQSTVLSMPNRKL